MSNKYLLKKDVEDLGRSGDVVNAKPGYARNFLLPHGYAVVADKQALKMQARLQEARRLQAAEDKKDSEKLAAAIEGVILTTIVKVDHEGHMYGSVSANDVAELLSQQIAQEVEKRSVQSGLKHAIKETGVYPLVAKLKEGVTANFTLKVISEEEHKQNA